MRNEAIIVIPGLDAREIGYALERVVKKISERQQISDVNILGEGNGQKKSVELTFKHTSEKKTIDVFEVFWGDIVNENYSEELPLWKKVIFGLELITFWVFSSVWKGALKNKFLFSAITFSGLIITGWYLSVLGILATAIYNTKFLVEHLALSELPAWFPEVSLGLGIFLGAFPTALLIRASGFSMKFIKSALVRDAIKGRIGSQMNYITTSNKYDRVTLFSHSMGAIPTIDYLSNYQKNSDIKVRSITVGAAISFFAYKSSLIRTDLIECSNNSHIDEWLDFFSKEDYLCAYETIDELGENFYSQELKMDSSWLSRLSNKVHVQYFDDSRVIEKLIS
ncbi:hypothetical protein U6A24_13410 [Aquimarina gracilis]|uniref:Uncharacterized protein n=1 Tax=Aquimarina gracilis TaxID=874422 RepID=A0ABU5ZX74_9FLAO|nr:hypothetical protein [Aquimarina gracilis]MEB3346469.1 hypothetical protein [Aquimarina gracilis]